MKVWKYSLEVLGPKREGKYVNVEGRLYFPKRGVVGYEMLGDGEEGGVAARRGHCGVWKS